MLDPDSIDLRAENLPVSFPPQKLVLVAYHYFYHYVQYTSLYKSIITFDH